MYEQNKNMFYKGKIYKNAIINLRIIYSRKLLK